MPFCSLSLGLASSK